MAEPVGSAPISEEPARPTGEGGVWGSYVEYVARLERALADVGLAGQPQDRVLTEDLTDEALAEVHRWHAIVHPDFPGGGVYEPARNPSGCDRFFCLTHVVECSAVAAPRWYHAGISKGRRQAVEYVASLLGHDLVLADDTDAVGLLAAAITTARDQGRRQATEGAVDRATLAEIICATRDDAVHQILDEDYVCGDCKEIAKEVRQHVLSRLVGPWEPAEQLGVPIEGDRRRGDR